MPPILYTVFNIKLREKSRVNISIIKTLIEILASHDQGVFVSSSLPSNFSSFFLLHLWNIEWLFWLKLGFLLVTDFKESSWYCHIYRARKSHPWFLLHWCRLIMGGSACGKLDQESDGLYTPKGLILLLFLCYVS